MQLTSAKSNSVQSTFAHEIDERAVPGRRPKLLFLAYHFPPSQAVASVRAWNMAKYLARLGWEVTVITPDPSLWRSVNDPVEADANLRQEGIRRILTRHDWCCLNPSLLKSANTGIAGLAGGICRRIAWRLKMTHTVGWAKHALRACSALPETDVDIILATGSPFLAFKLARRLADRFGCPYVLDYRDPWTGNPHASRPDRPSTIREERKLLAGSAAVTIVSPSWARAMERRFDIGTKLHVLTNGYDPEEVADVKPKDYAHFSIIYTGLFYPPKRVISPVMAALSRLKSTLNGADGEWFFHYYGTEGDHVLEESRRFNVTERVVIHGRVSRPEVLSALRGADVALVISSVVEEKSVEDHGIVPGKLFETLGLGTPILLIGPPGSDASQMISESGVHGCFSGTDVQGIVHWLQERVRERNRGVSNPAPKLAWPQLAKNLDSLLREQLPSRELIRVHDLN